MNVNFLNGATPVTATEVGPLLQDVLDSVKPKFSTKCGGDKYSFYVVATGSDGYTSLLSWGDGDPTASGRSPLLSVNQNGTPLNTGPRVLAPGDVRGDRYVSGTVALTVLRAKPAVAIRGCRRLPASRRGFDGRRPPVDSKLGRGVCCGVWETTID
jgi:hypothetical protein